jgi:ABC-type oligopeptide transport system substrate-binding subunit
MKKRRKLLLFLTMFVSLSIALCGCRGDKSSADTSSITVGIPQDIEDSLDPHKAKAAGTKEVLFNIYEGLVKSTKPQHSGYCTFRRISDKSDDNSWIHKGFSAHKFMEKALQNIENKLGGIVESAKFDFLDAKFGG